MLLIYFLLLCEDNLMWHGLQVKLELNNANASPNDVHILQCRDKPVLVSLCKNSSFICELKGTRAADDEERNGVRSIITIKDKLGDHHFD